jgi:hypothetical protein
VSPKAGGPLGSGFDADFELGCSRVQSHTLEQDFSSEFFSQNGSKSGILMDVHSVSVDRDCFTQSASPVFDRMDNLLKDHI